MKMIGRVFCLGSFVLAAAVCGAQQKSYDVKGTWVEGCSCNAVCACEINGVEKGCQGVGVAMITSGSVGGVDISGARVAYAVAPGSWVRLYLQAKDKKQLAAAEAFGRKMTAAFGKTEAARAAKVDLTGSNGAYTLTVDGGKVMKMTTTPLIGVDKKTPVVINNYPDPLNHQMAQAKVVSAAYHDGSRQFTLKGTNSFFNTAMAGAGKM